MTSEFAKEARRQSDVAIQIQTQGLVLYHALVDLQIVTKRLHHIQRERAMKIKEKLGNAPDHIANTRCCDCTGQIVEHLTARFCPDCGGEIQIRPRPFAIVVEFEGFGGPFTLAIEELKARLDALCTLPAPAERKKKAGKKTKKKAEKKTKKK